MQHCECSWVYWPGTPKFWVGCCSIISLGVHCRLVLAARWMGFGIISLGVHCRLVLATLPFCFLSWWFWYYIFGSTLEAGTHSMTNWFWYYIFGSTLWVGTRNTILVWIYSGVLARYTWLAYPGIDPGLPWSVITNNSMGGFHWAMTAFTQGKVNTLYLSC